MAEQEKPTTAQADSIEQSSDSGHDNSKDGSNVDDAIIHDLETSGDDVGLTLRSVLAAGTMASCYTAYLFTLLIPPAVLSFINSDLGPDARFTWITISWNLGGAIFVTTGGRLSDIFGRRYFFLSGAVILIIGSIVSATGQSINQMIAGGALFGAGSGFLEMAFGAVQEVVPTKYRMITIGLFDVSSVIAQIMPLISWVLIRDTGDWRNAYYLMIAFQALNLIFLFFCYHPPAFATKHSDDGKSFVKLIKEFDWLGLVVFTIGCSLFLIGVSWGGTMYPWKSAGALAPIIIGLVMLICLGFYEAYGNVTEPLLPPRLFKEIRLFLMPMITMAIAGVQYYSNATLWNRLSQLLYASDEISKGLYAEVLPLGTILGGICVIFSKKIGHQRWQVFLAIGLQTGCVGGLSTATIDNPVKSIILTCIVSMCASIVILNSIVLIGFGIRSQDDIGTAAGLAGTSRLLFGAVGTAIFSTVTNNKYDNSLTDRVMENIQGLSFPSENIAQLVAAAKLSTAEAFKAVPSLTPEVQAAAVLANKEAYLLGAVLSYQAALAFGLCGCIAALFIRSVDTRKYTMNTVAVQEQDRVRLDKKEAAPPSV
ncbi:hypothetical protein AJ80_03207 [Polytolypa hystricis UAMH7299]|uniref:Major facilitator superfamily (MFS) profile domain-containing protein n=1 Tax=Polytolypa hystricis (strain UAMH7299) TaxID=1447883 RepID=A0A2B7YIM8_POLH7|nr:hypothetical protein AJ80_03207 [Polytolypa hystricis UAMH7299]